MVEGIWKYEACFDVPLKKLGPCGKVKPKYRLGSLTKLHQQLHSEKAASLYRRETVEKPCSRFDAKLKSVFHGTAQAHDVEVVHVDERARVPSRRIKEG